jgi:hypothetical protein
MADPRYSYETAIPEILAGEIIDANVANWTVDVYSKMTDRVWTDIPVGAPYLHHFTGEGMYVVPEVGAACQVCIPGDNTTPFVLCFVAPPLLGSKGVEADEDNVDPETGEVTGQRPYGGYASFGAQRPPGKPGDICFRGRDGNFVTLHRGGVLQLGANELSQRIFIPLRNLMMDISGRYEHHSTGGSINWGMQEGQYEDRDTQFVQTYRIYADDKYADIRTVCGKVIKPTPLPDVDAKDRDKKTYLEVGKDTDTVYEVTLCPGGFNNNGELSVQKAYNQMKFTFQLDDNGRAYCRFDGNVFLSIKGSFFIRVKEDFELEAKSIRMTCSEGAEVGSTGGVTKVMGTSVELCGAGPGVARQGDSITVALPPAISSMLPPGTPGFLFGNIMTGSSKVKAG